MTSSKPYLLRALWQWLVDNDLTPYLQVSAKLPSVDVPMEFVNDGQIILNTAPMAVKDLDIANCSVTFSARFSGKPRNIYVPINSVMAIYAKENGRGMVFDLESEIDDAKEDSVDRKLKPIAMVEKKTTSSDDKLKKPSKDSRKPSLKIVK